MAKPERNPHHPEGQRAFNERLAQRQKPKPRDISGPWLSNEAMNNLPRVRRAFDLNRDPMIAKQIRDNEKTESQRRQEQVDGQAGRGSTMVKQDRPAPAPHPTGPDADAVNREAFKERWLTEQRDAAMAQAEEQQSTPELARDMARASKEPSR